MGTCNGCTNIDMKRKLRKNYLLLTVDGWPTVYELDAPPVEGQGPPFEHDGRPIRFCIAFMRLAHSYDEDCRQGR